ncbi:hypothetical protein [Kineosporia sp. R_H_3]|uniref:hypothetical protein n=1 Tax=Kineosporia sp. R_H_3 TaxID=1961848 RepID=UPI000B4B6D0C|nr:hypothetical protein [Kineosporia sp. R_H_3]
MLEIQMVRAWLATTQQRLQRRDRDGVIEDRGDIVQTVIIVGLFAAAAILVVGILVAKATQAANSVKTQ